TQDHLDFFKDMKTYTMVKESYFHNENVRLGIINADDIVGRKIIDSKDICCLSYGLYYPSDVFALNIEYDKGTRFVANIFDDVVFIKTPLLGEFNVSNTLAAISVCKVIGINSKDICEYLQTLKQIEGRFDVITNQKTAIIDYAHTPDGLKNAMLAARKLCKGKLIVVFGCGGNRDISKRPIMGKIAAQYSDIAVITSDNPRFENPEEIIESIANGFSEISHSYIKICDRQKAIEFALSIADKNDIVLIAGKGGEDYMDIKGEKLPYSDKEVCQKILRRFTVD
ncbi:UDP-N-acetylmuramyl-tripeptide synthetase, partial [bacterium]|nr:UDP-N-acetylmuramyl-tripeptide synthetase [bacterium]